MTHIVAQALDFLISYVNPVLGLLGIKLKTFLNRACHLMVRVYVSSRGMHSGSIALTFEKQGIELPAPHLHTYLQTSRFSAKIAILNGKMSST